MESEEAEYELLFELDWFHIIRIHLTIDNLP